MTTFSKGHRIGSYQVVDTLGTGGMGHVYRATDARLGRDVAIKTLPDSLASDPDALARFEREARMLAAVNHHNVAAIYGIEEHDGQRFLILELVPGETLAAALAREPFSVRKTLDIAIQIASALDAAHRGGIVHRDLKPSNVALTADGRVKLIDFGIAKHFEPSSATTNEALTRAGLQVGTPQYMSPEQMFGESTDRRADIWAFGCLLFEMLSGVRPFDKRTDRGHEPDWTLLPRDTPEPLRQLIARCVQWDPANRLDDIGVARAELERLTAERSALGGPRRRSATLAMAAGVAIIVVLAVLLLARRPSTAATPPKLTQITTTTGVQQSPAWSPDGQRIVFARDTGGIRQLYIKKIGSADQELLTRSEFDDLEPTWTPDGASILFTRARGANHRIEPGDVFADFENNATDIWKLDLATHREALLIQNAAAASASPDGKSIAFYTHLSGGARIWVSEANGSNPVQISSDSSEAIQHFSPHWSPDGRSIVYQRLERTKFDVAAVDVRTHKWVKVTTDNYRDINPVWARDGKSIFFSSDRGGGMNIWRMVVDAEFHPVGQPRQLTTGAGQDVQIAVAPDGTRLAYATLHQNADIWRLPLAANGTAAGAPQPLIATTREDSRGAWSPDGKQIAFNSDREGDMNIWLFNVADGNTRRVTSGPGGDFQPSWSPDGKQLAFFSSRAGKTDIWKVDLASGQLTQLTHSHSLDINPFWSPDGRQIVFQSDASGRLELWIMNADGGAARQLTTVGVSGHFERWMPDGLIYFRCPSKASMMRVAVATGAVDSVSKNGAAHISFSPDRTRFIDVPGHKVLWLYSLSGSAQQLYKFPDEDVRIDYPVWSPDGRWLLFDRFRPEGGDIWLAEGIQ